MKVIYHKDRPLLEFPEEPWRPPLRVAVNRSAGAESVSVWLHDVEGEKRAPLHYHDVEEVLVFIDVQGEGFVRVGEEEHKVETQTSVVVPPGTMHCFGLRGQGSLRAMAVLPDADAVLGHRMFEKGNESFEMPPLKKQGR
jgi:mannose-6-phosphate isomerase-like protein (cupin superfamily)